MRSNLQHILIFIFLLASLTLIITEMAINIRERKEQIIGPSTLQNSDIEEVIDTVNNSQNDSIWEESEFSNEL